MTEILPIVTIVLLVVVIALLIALLFRKTSVDLSPLQQALQATNKVGERAEQTIREEFARNRAESSVTARQSREEFNNTLRAFADGLNRNFTGLTQAISSNANRAREETASSLQRLSETLVNNLGEIARLQEGQLNGFSERLDRLTQTNEQKLDRLRETIEQRLGVLQEESGRKLTEMRQEATASIQRSREEVTAALRASNESVSNSINDFVNWQRTQFGGVIEQLRTLTDSNEKRLDTVRTTLETKLKALQDDNTASLEKMRQTVDEKLHETLDKRLGESFRRVSDQLESVYKGLGEMQSLAVGVGDLKRVLTNVRARGTWGEVQLERMLEQVLCPDQYDKNVATKEGGEFVEFAIKLPGRGDDKDDIVWLPVDSKFPIEDYQRLQDAQEKGDAELAEAAGKQLEIRIKGCAADICGKYLSPPKTTDFGILFLPTEGLFAEVLRRPGLPELLQAKYKVMVAGPTTLWSILNSLQMGFRTLAIQQRSSEVWKKLAEVKTEFGNYGDVLAKVQKKLQEATNTIDTAAVRTRAIQRKLRDVEELPAADAQGVLMIEGVAGEGDVVGNGEADCGPEVS